MSANPNAKPVSLRHNELIALFRQHGFLTMEALAEHFAVTPQTIRRDINALCDADILRRRHGGAELILSARNQPYDTRRINNLQQKEEIGAAVAALIPNGCSVLIGIGTTPEQVALALAKHDHLTVITNNLRAALALSTNQNNQVIVPGGTLRFPNPEILGGDADKLFRNFRADFGIYGVGGVDTDGTLLDFDRMESSSRQALRESCRTQILVTDHSKFGRQAPVRGGHLSDPDILVTDSPLSPALHAMLAGKTQLVVTAQTSAHEQAGTAAANSAAAVTDARTTSSAGFASNATTATNTASASNAMSAMAAIVTGAGK